MEIEDQQTTTLSVSSSSSSNSTCFICNDKLLEVNHQQQEHRLEETKLLSVIFHLHLSSYQLGYLAQELICIKCSQILSSIQDLFTNLQKIQKEIKQNRCMVKTLITNAYLQNSTNKNILEVPDNNDEIIKQRVALQDKIIHSNDGDKESSTIPTFTDKNPTYPTDYLEIFEIDEQTTEPAEQNNTNTTPPPPPSTLNLQHIISTQPSVKVCRMPILDQLIRNNPSSGHYQHQLNRNAKLIIPPAPKSRKRLVLNQQQQRIKRIKLEKKPPVIIKKEVGFLEVFEGIEAEELITGDLDYNELDFTDYNNDLLSQQSPDVTNYTNVKLMYVSNRKKKSSKPKKKGNNVRASAPARTKNASRRPRPRTRAPTPKTKSTPSKPDSDGNYLCTICAKPFKTSEYAKIHVLTHNPGDKPYKCTMSDCDAGYWTSRALSRHVREAHDPTKSVEEGKDTLNNVVVRRRRGGSLSRLNVKKTKAILPCPECSRTFTKAYTLKIHLESHKPMSERSTAHTCNICSMRFLQHSRLQRHLKHVHDPNYKSSRKPAPKVQCPKCDLQVINLPSHLRTHEDAKPFICSTCGACFRAKKTLDVHLRIHSDVRPYACKACPASFRTSHGLNRHAYIHSEERTFVCEHCGKSFRFKSSLTEHLHIHLQVKPHRCNVCGRRYKERGELEIHLRDDHTKEQRERTKGRSGGQQRGVREVSTEGQPRIKGQRRPRVKRTVVPYRIIIQHEGGEGAVAGAEGDASKTMIPDLTHEQEKPEQQLDVSSYPGDGNIIINETIEIKDTIEDDLDVDDDAERVTFTPIDFDGSSSSDQNIVTYQIQYHHHII